MTNRKPRPPWELLAEEEQSLQPSDIDSAAVGVDRLAAIFQLEAIRGFGPQKFKELHLAGVVPELAVASPMLLPFRGKIGQSLLAQLQEQTAETGTEVRLRAVRQIRTAAKVGAKLLTYEHPQYPRRLFESNDAVPVLYARGNVAILNEERAVACVGSRNIAEPYSSLHSAFASFSAGKGYTVVSGFALGADTLGHQAAIDAGGRTICVMPGGLDRPFPPENRSRWDEYLQTPHACFVTEFPFGRAAAGLTLRKRNKMITALAAGVLVSQSSSSGGAMNAYRFALEQRRALATFEPDGQDATSGNREIAVSEKASTTVFSLRGQPDEWSQWLDGLSSST